jgi:G3E family GTPase
VYHSLNLFQINKTDLVPSDHLANLVEAVSRINGLAPKLFTNFGKVDLDKILDLHAYDGKEELPTKFPSESKPHLVSKTSLHFE